MNSMRTVALAWALTGASLLIGSTAGAAEPVGAKTKQAEFSALQARAAKLATNTGGLEWQQLVKDLDAWAANHGAQTQTESVASAAQSGTGSPTGSKKPCKPYFQNTPGYYCVLDPSKSDTNTCFYRCVKY